MFNSSSLLFRNIPPIKTALRRISLSVRDMLPVKVGDDIPGAELYENCPANVVNVCQLTSDRKIILFGVPGAFTPGCSKTHLPGYVAKADELMCEHEADEIICVSVNDPFVMAAWAKDQNVDGRVRLLADPSAKFVKALGLEIDLPPLGGVRSKRFSMVVDDGVITELNVEPDGTGLSCSLAENLGKQ